MPTWATDAPFGIPLGVRRLVLFRPFPQHKIQRIVLVQSDSHTLTRLQLIQTFARQFAIACKLPHGIIHITIGRLIGQAIGFQLINDVQHLRHIFRRAWFMGWAFNAQCIGIVMHGRDKTVGQCANRLTIFQSTFDDFIVDVGDVAHINHLIARHLQPTLNHVKRHHNACVPQMTIVIHRHATHIHAHLVGIHRLKHLLQTGQGIVNA